MLMPAGAATDAVDPMRMIVPSLCSSGIADWIVKSTPLRLIPTILSNCSSVILPRGACSSATALAMTVSSLPCLAFTSLSSASISVRLDASALAPKLRGPISSTALSSRSCWRPVTTTVAPCATNSLAIAKPIPVVPPVTTATFPSSEKLILPPVDSLSSSSSGKHIAAEVLELRLCGGTNDDLVDIDVGRLLDRERDSASDRLRRHCEPVPRGLELGLHLRTCHSCREVRPHEAGRNDRHAQLVACLLAQALGDRTHSELRPGIDRLVRHRLMSSRRGGVNEMTESLLAKHWERRRDAVQNAFDIDVDHLLPILDAQVVEGRHGHYARIGEENVQLAVSLAS